MKTIQVITNKLIEFRDKRDWKQFHKPKDIAISVILEAAELLEHFQWKNDKEVKAYIKVNKNDIAAELADVFNWVLLLSHDLGIDIEDACLRKIRINGLKYPVKKVKGRHTKYNKL